MFLLQATSGFTLIDYGIIFFVILILAVGVGLFLKFRGSKKKSGVPIIVMKRTATGLMAVNAMGFEDNFNTQKMIDIPSIGRKLNYPNPAQMSFGTLLLLQTDEITFRPLVLKDPATYPKELRDVIERLKVDTDEEPPEKTSLEQAGNRQPEFKSTGKRRGGMVINLA